MSRQENTLPLLVAALAADAAPLVLPAPLASMLRRAVNDMARGSGVDPELLTALNMLRDLAVLAASVLPLTTLAVIVSLMLPRD